jgi:hypothetical protein
LLLCASHGDLPISINQNEAYFLSKPRNYFFHIRNSPKSRGSSLKPLLLTTLTSSLHTYLLTYGEKRNAYRILVGKPEGKRPLGRPRRRWVDNIRMDLRKIGCDDVDWIDLAQDRDQWRALVSTVMNLRVP